MAAPSNTSYRLEKLDPLRSANLVQIKSVAVVLRSHWGKISGYSQVNPQCKWIKKEKKKGLWPFRLLHDPGPIQVQTGSIHRSDCWSADPGYFFGHPLTQRPDLGYPGINPVWKGNYIGFYLTRSLFLRDNFDLLFPLGFSASHLLCTGNICRFRASISESFSLHRVLCHTCTYISVWPTLTAFVWEHYLNECNKTNLYS